MNIRIYNKYELRAKIMKALAHPTRLFIIEELEKQEICVQDLTEMIGSDISTVSKHLSVLKNAGLVIDRKEKNCVYYRLKVKCVLNFLGCVEDVIQQNASLDNKYINLWWKK
jgi:ArsR family transcriptional regulator